MGLYQRDHCSLGLALGKYTVVTKRLLPAAPLKKQARLLFYLKSLLVIEQTV